MIIELDGNALLALANGKAVAIEDHIVRPADETRIIATSTDELKARRATARTANGRDLERHASQVRGNRTGRTGAHKIASRFPGGCYIDRCANTWAKGEPIVYDYDNRKAYCMGHGLQRFPTVKLREGANA